MAAELELPFISRETLQLIEKVGRELPLAGDYDTTLRVVTRVVVPVLADLTVMVLAQDGRPDRIEVAHLDPSREAGFVERLQPVLPALTRMAAQEWERGRQFRWVPSVSHASFRFLHGRPEIVELVHALEIHSLMVVPLRSGGRILGGIGFARIKNQNPFHAGDLAVAQVIARRAAASIESAELHERSLDERVRSARLEDAVQKWIRVFDLAGWGAAIVDAMDWRIDAVNPAFARIHGHPKAEALSGRLFTDLLAPDHAHDLDRWPSAPESQPQAYESLHVRADGTIFPVLTNVTPLGTTPVVTSFVVTVQDVTALKRTEERLRRAQRMEAVGRLAGGVAHEVNNMMTIILGFGDLLAAAPDLPKERFREVDEIRKAAIRTARVTQQLLAFSRQQVLQPADLRLEEVVAEFASVLRHLLPANIRVETSLARLPSIVHVDRAQLDQVLINLAFNARDAMPLGGSLRIGTESRHFEAQDGHQLIGIAIEPGPYACLDVSDTGHGMDAATLAQIFEPFFTTKPVGTSTGLGLATVYGIVKQSGGFIWAESTPGVGTAFTVCFPQVASAAAATQRVQMAEVPLEPSGGATLLLVEDEDGVRELTRRMLEKAGYEVLEAKTGAEVAGALSRKASEIDLVVSDVDIPDMATVELEDRIRTLRPELPVLYMSGYSRDEVVARGLVPHDRPFIQKPFTAPEMTAEVSKQLHRAAARGGPVTT